MKKYGTGIGWTLAAVLAALVVIEYFFAPHYKPVFPWHHVTGYMAGIGGVACLALILLAKFVAKPLLQRPDPEDPVATDEELSP